MTMPSRNLWFLDIFYLFYFSSWKVTDNLSHALSLVNFIGSSPFFSSS